MAQICSRPAGSAKYLLNVHRIARLTAGREGSTGEEVVHAGEVLVKVRARGVVLFVYAVGVVGHARYS